MSIETNTEKIKSPASNVRKWIIVFLFIAYVIAFFDRSNISVLIADKSFTDILGITANKSSQGLLTTSFLLFYGITCFFAGPIVQKLGVRKTLSYSLIAWAVIMAIMGSVSSFMTIIVFRALLGVGEAVIGPCTSKLIQTWFPVQERGKANGVWFTGVLAGQVLAMPLVAGIVSTAGWRTSFYVLAALGLIPAIAAFVFVYDKVTDHPKISKEEIDYITQGEKEGTTASVQNKVSFEFLKSGNFWLLILIYSCSTAAAWGIMAWMPSYLQASLGFSWGQMGSLAMLPYVGGAFVALCIAPLMDKFNKRAPFLTFSFLGFVVFFYLTTVLKNTSAAFSSMTLGFSILSLTTPAIFTIMQNIVKRNQIATATGFLNGFAYICSSAVPFLMGVLYNKTGTLNSGLLLLVGLTVVGLVSTISLVKQRL